MGYVDRYMTKAGERFRAVAKIDGKRVLCGSFDSETAAEIEWRLREDEARKLADAAAERAADRAATAADATLGATASAWLRRRRLDDLSRQTIYGYDLAVRTILASPIADLPLADVTDDDIAATLKAWRESGAGLSTVASRHKVLRMIFRRAALTGTISGNPASIPKLRKPPGRRNVALSNDDVAALVASAAQLDPTWAAFVLCGVDAGLRWAEVAGLAASAVTGQAIIVRQVVEHDRAELRDGTKSGADRTRVVPMPARLSAALRPLAAAARLRGGPDALIFTAEDGGPLHYANYRHRVWPKIRSNAKGLRNTGVTFHWLRHTYQTRLSAAGVPITERMVLLGHSDPKTAQGYDQSGGTAAAAWVAHALDGAASPLAGIRRA